jgi:hypothetical protein
VFVVGFGITLRAVAMALGADHKAACLGSVLGVLTVLPWLVERPQLATYAFTPVALLLAVRASTPGRCWPWALALVATFGIWANLHSAALSGLAVVAAAGIGATFDARRTRPARTATRATLALCAAALGTLLTPFGVELWTHAADVRSQSVGTISEWEPLWSSGASGWFWLAAIVVTCALALRRGRHHLALIVPLAATALLAADAIRSVPVYLAVAAVVLPVVMGPIPSRLERREDLLRLASSALLVVAAIVTFTRAPTLTSPAGDTPVASVESLPSGCRVLNDYRFGNWIMFDRPDVLVSDDGRNDLHGDNSALDHLVAGSVGAAAEITALGVDCVLVDPSSPLVDQLIGARWTANGRDGVAVALVAPVSG